MLRVTSFTFGTSIATGYDYDINGNQSAEQHYIPGSATTTTYYYFDRQHNPTYIVYPDNAEVYYGYGTSGLLSNVQELEPGGSAFTILTSNYTYSPIDQVAKVGYYANGTGSINTYDAAHLYRLYSRAAYNSSKYFQYQVFQYDPMGLEAQLQDLSSTDSAKTVTFGYSDLYHLTTASSTSAANGQNFKQTFTYDTLGNMLSNNGTTYSYQGYTGTNYANPNAVTSVGSTTYTYDADGNLYTNGTLTNLWDYKDRLGQTVSTIGTTTATTTYTYDQGTNRITMTTGGVTTYYPNKYYSTNSSGKKDKYVYVGDQLLATIETVGTTTNFYYNYPDQIGSTDIVANSSGIPIQTLDYYPYGSLRLNEASTTFDSLQKYISQPFDAATSLNYFDARYENPSQGQFISEDSIFANSPSNQNYQDPQSLNSYAYAGDNPITQKDPTGKYFELSYSQVTGLNTFSFGARFDSNGIDVFGGGGKGFGLESGVEAAWVPNQYLSHQSGATLTASGEAAATMGLRVSQNLLHPEPISSKNGDTGRPSVAAVLGGGYGVGTEEEFTTPLLTWGNYDPNQLSAASNIVSTLSLPNSSGTYTAPSRYGGLAGGLFNSIQNTLTQISYFISSHTRT